MPLCDSGPGHAEIFCQLRETAATAPDDGKAGHVTRLHQVSRARKQNLLTQRKRGIKQTWPMEIGQKIRLARENSGFGSQRALAKALGLTPGLIGAWESHKKSPGRETLKKLARATAQPLSYFIDGVVADEAVLETRNPEEIEVILLFRKISPNQQRTHLALLRQSVSIRAGKEP